MGFWTFTLLAVGGTAAAVLLGGVALWAGVRFLARVEGVSLGRGLSVYIFAAIVAFLGYAAVRYILFAMVLGPYGAVPGRIVGAAVAVVGMAWAVKKAGCGTWAKAALALLPAAGHAGLVVWAASSVAGDIREADRAAECRHALAELGIALARYAEEHGGRLPEDSVALRATMGSDWVAPRCPSAAGRADGGHFYFSGAGPKPLNAAEPGFARRLVACDLRPHGPGRNVLRGDGWACWLSEDQFQTELAAPHNADFARAFRAETR